MKLRGYDNYLFDFDGTIATLNIDWASFKKKVDEQCMFAQINTKHTLSFKIDNLKKTCFPILELVKMYEQPEGMINFCINKKVVKFIKNQIEGFIVISNNMNSTVRSALETIGLLYKCRAIVGIDNVEYSKPRIDSYELLKDKLVKGSTIYIGNTNIDKEFANNCNIEFCYVDEIIYDV